MCGCKKEYLSYPALYTHVKLKHDGKFPQGSTSKRLIMKGDTSAAEDFKKKGNLVLEIKEFLNKILVADLDEEVAYSYA